MIKKETKLRIIDNSGLLLGKCFKIDKPSYTDVGHLCDYILFSVKKKIPNSPIKKKTSLGLIAGTNKNFRRKSGHLINFKRNNLLVMEDKTTFPYNNVLKPVPLELRYLNINQLLLIDTKFI